MAEGIVDLLEKIEIEKQDSNLMTKMDGLQEGVIHTVGE